MTKQEANHIIQILIDKGIQFEVGLNETEILKVETQFSIKLPPDLKLFLQTALPVSESFVNWRLGICNTEEADKINSRLDWPLDGMLFDLQSNNFWVDSWGNKPGNLEERFSIVKKHYETYPKLIPIFSHRYIPCRPNKVGNPVLSVYQMDIIYYGYNLATYFANEFHFTLPDNFEMPSKPKLAIEFWSDWT